MKMDSRTRRQAMFERLDEFRAEARERGVELAALLYSSPVFEVAKLYEQLLEEQRRPRRAVVGSAGARK